MSRDYSTAVKIQLEVEIWHLIVENVYTYGPYPLNGSYRLDRPGTGLMKKRRIIYIVGVAFLGLLIWRIGVLIFAGQGGPSGRFSSPPVAVQVQEVAYQPIQETMQMTGTIYPLYRYIVAPKVAGRMISA